MKLQPDPKQALNTVTRYDAQFVEVNEIRYQESIVVMPEGDILQWNVSHFDKLSREDFARIALKSPALVIFGSGKKLRFPSPYLIQDFIQAKIGFETMDTQAACRTYNILMSEGRLVMGIFMMEQE